MPGKARCVACSVCGECSTLLRRTICIGKFAGTRLPGSRGKFACAIGTFPQTRPARKLSQNEKLRGAPWGDGETWNFATIYVTLGSAGACDSVNGVRGDDGASFLEADFWGVSEISFV